MKEVTPEGLEIETFPDGSKVVKYPSGAILEVSPDGVASAHVPEIKSVGLSDLSQVVEHRINTVLGSRSHFVRFANGSSLTFAFNDKGDLLDLSAKDGCDFSLATDGSVLFSAKPPVKK